MNSVWAIVKRNKYGDTRIFYYDNFESALKYFRSEKNNPSVRVLRLMAGDVENVSKMNNVLNWEK